MKEAPCSDCGKTYPPYVMQFDHVNGGKLFSVGNTGGSVPGLGKFLAEVDKCELVCANCHAERTHQRRLWQTA